MFRFIIYFVFAMIGVHGHFHKFLHHLNKHITYDMNGFKGPHGRPFVHPAPPPPSLPFGPLPQDNFQSYPHYHQHHHHPSIPDYLEHRPQFDYNNPNSNYGNGFPNMMPFNPFNPFFGPNLPFNPIQPFNVPNSNPSQYDGKIPNQSINVPKNPPFQSNPLSTSQSTSNANTQASSGLNVNMFINPSNVQNPVATHTLNSPDPINANIRPQNGMHSKFDQILDTVIFCVIDSDMQ